MFIHYRTRGFIFKKENRGEADQLFSVFTKDFGKLEILGKAIRKIKSKLRSGVEIFYLSEIEFIQGKKYKTLIDSASIDKFPNIRKDLRRLNVAYKISEILDELIQTEEPEENIWQLLKETFEKLDKPSLKFKNLQLIYYYFFWNLLAYLGYQPQLYNCIYCQKKITLPSIYFSSREGGVICRQCFKKYKEAQKVEQDAIKILRLILEKNWPVLNRLKIENSHLSFIKNISEDYLSSVLEEKE